MPRKKSKSKSKKKVHWRKAGSKKKKKRERPYKISKVRHAKRRHRKRHPKSRVLSRNSKLFEEAETANYLLNQLLKTTSAEPEQPYNYHPRHYSKDKEYQSSAPRLQEFKRGIPAPDVQMWRPPPYQQEPYIV